MMSIDGFSSATRRVWLCVWLCAAAATMLIATGCANTKPGALGAAGPAPGAEIVTDSDESPARKRARIRLDLALGYFEQGQTTVALDEIKQSLAADPTYAEALNLRGLVYMRLDEPALAEDSFRRAIAVTPRDPNLLHNYGWLLCQQRRYGDATAQFNAALAVPSYRESAKTLMTQGVCQIQAGQRADAERTLLQAYEIDAANPVVGFNLASLLAQREDFARAQFFIRRVNNSPSANAESLWLGIKVERRLGGREALAQLVSQLQRRFPASREALAYERGNFND